MKRSRLRNTFLNTKTDIDKKQRNLCVYSIRREKKNIFNSISASVTTDNKNFWKTVKDLLRDNVLTKSKII